MRPSWNIADGKATFEGEITNLPDDVRTYGDADLLQRWQAAGGKYVITSLKGRRQRRHFDVSGTIGLDTGGRTEGQLNRLLAAWSSDSVRCSRRSTRTGSSAIRVRTAPTARRCIAAGVVFSGFVPTGVIPPLF